MGYNHLNDVSVDFGIDSGLLYPISEYRLFVRLWFTIPFTACKKETIWYEIASPNPLLALTSNTINPFIIHLGLTDEAKKNNDTLLDWMKEFRKDREGKEESFSSVFKNQNPFSSEPQNTEIPLAQMAYPKHDKMLAKLEVKVVLPNEREEGVETLKLSRWIVPANNYRGEN